MRFFFKLLLYCLQNSAHLAKELYFSEDKIFVMAEIDIFQKEESLSIGF